MTLRPEASRFITACKTSPGRGASKSITPFEEKPVTGLTTAPRAKKPSLKRRSSRR